MTKCIYNTDTDWLESLRISRPPLLNFWRKDLRNLNLSQNDLFYFRMRGTHFIGGKAIFEKIETLSIADAWNKYELGNGCRTKDEFISRCSRVIGIKNPSNDSKINCIILKNYIFLNQSDYIYIDEDRFPKSILACKFYKDNELEDLDNLIKIDSNSQYQFYDLDLIYDSKNLYEEGKIYLSQHLKRERNQLLIKQKKKHSKNICEICSFDFFENYKINYIEAHHKVPLHTRDFTNLTSLDDLALLCANFHRVVHKYMQKFPELNYHEIKEIIQKIRHGA